MRSKCFSCRSDQPLSRSSIRSKIIFHVCSAQFRLWIQIWAPDWIWTFFDYSISDYPEMWKVDITSGHGPKEVKTTWQVSADPPVEHMTSNNTGKEYLWWNEIMKLHILKEVFILGLLSMHIFLYIHVQQNWSKMVKIH